MAAQFSLVHGKQTRLLVIDPDGVRTSLSKVNDWAWKDDTKDLESIGLDGVREIMTSYQGVSGSFTSELQDSGLFDFSDDRRADYQAKNSVSRYSTIYVYMTMGDGSEIAYRLINVTLTIEDRGTAKHDETIKVKCKFMAQDVQRA
jgi:hypothetical protein